MNCTTLATHLTDFLEGDMSATDEAAAIEHLSTCNSCEGVLADTRRVLQLSHDHGRATLTDQDRTRLLDKLLDTVD